MSTSDTDTASPIGIGSRIVVAVLLAATFSTVQAMAGSPGKMAAGVSINLGYGAPDATGRGLRRAEGSVEFTPAIFRPDLKHPPAEFSRSVSEC